MRVIKTLMMMIKMTTMTMMTTLTMMVNAYGRTHRFRLNPQEETSNTPNTQCMKLAFSSMK